MTIKDVKYKYIIDSTIDLFLKKGIAAVTVKDVATAAGLGEATIYRYFSKKENLVTEIAISLEDEIFNSYFSFDRSLTGYELLSSFYNSFLKVFRDHIEFYRFINEFDSFVLNKDVLLDEYESRFDLYYKLFIDCYKKGLKDGTVKKISEIDTLYMSTTHALMGLCKKLANSDILKQDLKINKEEEIKSLIDIIMQYLKK